jgi:hypothetical protein
MSDAELDKSPEEEASEGKQHMDCVDIASYDSFPASDPPSWICIEPPAVAERRRPKEQPKKARTNAEGALLRGLSRTADRWQPSEPSL